MISCITAAIASGFRSTRFTGILLATLEIIKNRPLLHGLVHAIADLGLDVYLECSPPLFLENQKLLQDVCVSGLVIRNASTLSNGDKRDYFQLAPLQSTIKAFVGESCLRDFIVMAWETVENDTVLSNAVIRRALQWCNFYSVITWIGPERALTDADANTPTVEPLSAFSWLKEAEIMSVHQEWKSNAKLNVKARHYPEYDELTILFPQIESLLQTKEYPLENTSLLSALVHPPQFPQGIRAPGDALSVSPQGAQYTRLGCFPLGCDVTVAAFHEIVKSQQQLHRLDLLHPVPSDNIKNACILLGNFKNQHLLKSQNQSPAVLTAIEEFLDLSSNGQVRINLGLDSGFRRDNENRFWAVYATESEFIDIYVSKNAPGLIGTVLHTFLSFKGLSRSICFEIEAVFCEWSKDLGGIIGLPRRLEVDIESLSPSESLQYARHLSLVGESSDVAMKICTCIKRSLIEVPTNSQLKKLNTSGYLSGEITVEELIESRIAWYRIQRCEHPSLGQSTLLFLALDQNLSEILKTRRENDLANLGAIMKGLFRQGTIDAFADMIFLSIFCAVRKYAFDEIYVDVTDRNPLFNTQSDQAAAFAESFALGSRCEAYFDMSPSAFGTLLSDRFRAYYEKHPPPLWVNGAPELATSYAGAQIDVDPDDNVKRLPVYQQVTFMSVFAIPALIDILLLTFIGRGIYLSDTMSSEDLKMATTALMISLLLSGAIGTWISIGGTYYLISMAFSAMNMFVLTRLVAGLAFTFLAGLVGFITISCVQGPREAVIFFLYLFALTAYLSLFATLACFTYPGTSFLSGRKVILLCLPTLFLSPIITTFVGYDALVYLIVLFCFIGLLFVGVRSTAANWVTWYQNIRITNDSEIREWYISEFASDYQGGLKKLSDPAVLKLAREILLRSVIAEKKRSVFSQSKSVSLVRELARDWDSTIFLINWYCRYADVARPIPFSSGWNIQCKVALDTIRNAQKGIRLHNAFNLWRQAGQEIGCGILYFVIALLDKWVDLLCGGQLVGLAAGPHNEARVAIGLGLAYYLIGAVIIDIKAQHLHSRLEKTSDAIRSVDEIRLRQKDEVKIKRWAYWVTLVKFFTWHIWTVALTGSLVWWFGDSLESVIMYCAYVFSYTGLLWYQYTKIFAGGYVLMPLLISITIGLPVGISLRILLPKFAFSSVIGLAAATWSAALLSLWIAKIRMPRKTQMPAHSNRAFHAYFTPWSDCEWSQEELQSFFEVINATPQSSRLLLNPHFSPGSDIKLFLQLQQPDDRFMKAFPTYGELVKNVVAAWESERISIELVFRHEIGPGIAALSCTENGHLHIIIATDRGISCYPGLQGPIQIIAETLIHAGAESFLKIPHEYALFAESFVRTSVSETLSRQLRHEPDKTSIIKWANNEIIKQLCLGFNPDIHWDKLSNEIRVALLERCLEKESTLSFEQWRWLEKNLCQFDTPDLNVHIARCNLSCNVMIDILRSIDQEGPTASSAKWFNGIDYPTELRIKPPKLNRFFKACWSSVAILVKYLVMAIIAEPEFQREFEYFTRGSSVFWRAPLTLMMNMLWIYSKTVQDAVLRWFIFHKRHNIERLWSEAKGDTINIKRDRVVIQNLDRTYTAFMHPETDGFKMDIYSGTHKVEPNDSKLLKYVNIYSSDMLLQSRKEFANGDVLNEYHYDYRSKSKKTLSKEGLVKIPLSRRCVEGKNYLQVVQYNHKGLVEAGSYMKDENLIRFKYHYRRGARSSDELLRADFVWDYMSCTASWCAPPRRHAHSIERWIPHSKITEATYVYGSDVYESRWIYDHKFHPTISTYLNGQRVQTPPMIEFDHLDVLEKPQNTSFVHDNPLLFCDSLRTSFISRFLGLTKRRTPTSTSRARSLIWKAWKEQSDFDGVVVRWIDERLLRGNKVLAPYWRSRDRGNLLSARKYLENHADAVVASADLDGSVSSWTPLAIKLGDLFNFGAGGDAVNLTRSKQLSFDNGDKLHILAADNGTWPNEGGGVSACRRDMINGLRTIKWHMISESAHDFGIPKHQTERNINSLKIVPLWGLDFLTPTHGLFKNKLDAEIDDYTDSASDLDIKMNFIPILTAIVKSARAICLSHADVQQATRAFVNLNTYFDSFRHWSQVWTSEVVKEQWRYLWLMQDMPNAVPSQQWFDTELPTLGQLDTALELWYRYLFIFSIPVPEEIPPVFQASHHSVSATYGVVCKIKRQCTLQIWDHAISWRETNLCLSSALCKLSPFVRNALLGLMRVTSVLILHHADIVSPCADFFNPGWEIEIGTCQGTLEHRNRFRRKVDPVVNGITDMQRFTPVNEIKSERPTVTMLSHVWYAKDIKTAILAADLIINQWRFDDYHLDIYGAIDKAPTYSTECQELIASKGLRGRVTLRGTANPMTVLENTWLFLNSSLSEGLPLALGEAALTGAPVVCTDVGASLRVLSDPDDFSRFSAVVAPNDAQALARAQIQMLAMMGEWSRFAEDTEPPPILSSSPSPDEVEVITRRMYDKKEQRRKLGMMTRSIVQKSFSGDRYLREHEQMLWVGKSLKKSFSQGKNFHSRPESASETSQAITAVEEHIITAPPNAIISGRSSMSGVVTPTTIATDLPRNSTFRGDTIYSRNSGTPSLSSMESSANRHLRLPGFAPPRGGLPTTLLNEKKRSLPARLRREDLRQYRNSDLSMILRDGFLSPNSKGRVEYC
ncbi:glycosyl transferase [Talaromyces proteolyticus]|uniref:Glycosyl transferase n=1 Tax=Talaromyces proteolyticus TaxID=1131652 RepID=A0AAD4KRM8_9EURO|nr:glycosyl transferase [Talaromyces proteolyticus]KAH8694067.1 glycosyl transferase [Talaromyces proteolyticus]